MVLKRIQHLGYDELQKMDYYPFGKTNIVNAGTNNLYNGKELQHELGISNPGHTSMFVDRNTL